MGFTRGNKAISDHLVNGKLLLLFKALGKGLPVEFIGEFECASIGFGVAPDADGLDRKTIRFALTPVGTVEPNEDISETFEAKSLSEMRENAFRAISPPESSNWRIAKQIRRQRSNEIKAYVLRRANGVCELTGENAPFTKANGEPYLEVHHIQRLSDGGIDHPINCAAITPNSHREIHFGRNGKTLDERLAEVIRTKEEYLANTFHSQSSLPIASLKTSNDKPPE